MINRHPITPPTELVEQRWNKAQSGGDFAQEFAAFFAQWGADQQLEACDDYVAEHICWPTGFLTSSMRPKPPSLKEQALAILDDCFDHLDGSHENIIRRALEELPND